MTADVNVVNKSLRYSSNPCRTRYDLFKKERCFNFSNFAVTIISEGIKIHVAHNDHIGVK